MKAKKAAQVLGVNEGDDEATITAAFRTRAAQWHPDRNEGNRDEATRRFEEINRAFRALNQNGNTAGEAMDLSEMLLFFQFMMGGASQPTEDAAALSVSELKKRLEERGVDYAGCVEKSDLVELLERETAEDQRRVAKARRAARKKAQQRRKKAREKAERNSSEEQDAALVRVADAVSSGDAALARSALDEAERAHLAPGDKYARLFEHARELVRRADEDEARAREAAASEKASREKLEAKKERREARRRAEERAEAEARRKKELREAARKEKKQKRREARAAAAPPPPAPAPRPAGGAPPRADAAPPPRAEQAPPRPVDLEELEAEQLRRALEASAAEAEAEAERAKQAKREAERREHEERRARERALQREWNATQRQAHARQEVERADTARRERELQRASATAAAVALSGLDLGFGPPGSDFDDAEPRRPPPRGGDFPGLGERPAPPPPAFAPPPRQNFYGAAGSLAPPPHAAPAYGFQEPPAAPARQWNDSSLRAAQGLETRAPEFVPGAYGGGFAAGGYGGFGLANGAPADEDAYPEGGMGGIIEASLDSLVGGDA